MTTEPNATKETAEKKASVPTEAAVVAPKAAAATRNPANARLRMFQKLNGRFLPKGALRDRFKVLRARWYSAAPDHDGVTLKELESVHADWMAARA